jgi:hypothetical protein
VNNVADSTIKLAVVANDGIYRAEAAYGGANYKTLAEAVTAAATASADPSAVTVYNSAATIPSGYALVTAAGGAMTLRSAGNGELIYWASTNSGDWSGEDSNETHTFYTSEGGTSTTPYVDGDTVVIANDVQIWSKTAAHGANFQIGTDSAQAEVHFTRSGSDCDNYILDGSTVEVKSGSVLVVERYSDTNPPTQAYTAWDSYQNEHPDESAINDTSISGAGTVIIGGDTGGHGAAAAILSGATTITCPIALETGATLVVSSGCSVTTPTAVAAKKVISVVTDDETFARTYSVVDAAAGVVNGENVVNYATVQAAVNAVAYPGTIYDYVLAYQSASVTPASLTLKIKEDEDVTVTVNCPYGDYEVSESAPVDGVVTYSLTEKATTYTWVGTSGAMWGVVRSWKYDNSGVMTFANRLPNSADTVVFDGDATVTLNDNATVAGVEVGDGDVALTGSSKTLTAATGGIVLTDDGASITVDGVTLSPEPTVGELSYLETSISEGTTTYTCVTYGHMDGTTAVITNTTETVTIPASATAVAAQPTTNSFVIVASQAQFMTPNFLTLTAKYGVSGVQDITSAFESRIIGGDASAAQVRMTLTGSNTVSVDEETISVTPTLRAGNSDPAPMAYDAESGNPKFNIKAIPGLYYAVKAYSSPDCEDEDLVEAGSATQATSATVSPVAPAIGANTVQYYKISVGLSATEAQE